ncbi:MAG: cisplatin damage response ATP-dependent DNA ligase [Rubrivivax sp.]
MRRFAQLYAELDASTGTGDKLAALGRYFADAPAADAAWAVYFLVGGKPRQVVPTALLRTLAGAAAGIDDWLFDACYQAVGDLAETIAHLWPDSAAPAAVDGGATDPAGDDGLAAWVEQRVLPLRGLAPAEQALRLRAALDALDTGGRFVLVKLIGGGFRVGVSRLLVQRALAAHAGVDPRRMAERLMGWTEAKSTPTAARYLTLLAADPQLADGGTAPTRDGGQPYPFFLAHAFSGDPAAVLGAADDWQVEWKYDGIRAQLVKRAGRVWIWSRGEELVSDRFPELVDWALQTARLPDGSVLDGEVLAWDPQAPTPAPFQALQKRIARKSLTKKLLAEVPVRFIAYDLLESGGEDLRQRPQHVRRVALEALLPAAHVAPLLPAEGGWPALAAARGSARERGVEGLMLKQREARYGSGRTKADGVWWKWKVDPLSADGVLVYAQAGHGRRAGIYTDYTFAVWNRAPRDAAEAQAVVDAIVRRAPVPAEDSGALRLVPFAKAYGGLTDAEFTAVDREIRTHAIEKFGPVRSVRPTLVFEIGFDGIGASPRHKSGIAVRFPRMLRWRRDKPLHEADTLQDLEALMTAGAAPHRLREAGEGERAGEREDCGGGEGDER